MGSWEWEVGSGKLGVGKKKLKVGSWELEDLCWKLGVGSGK